MVPISKKYNRARYNPGAVITWSKEKAEARAFLAYLAGPSGKHYFKAHGYTVVDPSKHHS
jgi:ABC-type molybdate transport system substrate-binding protein